MSELKSRFALVTGAGHNIGRAIALALADAGAAVVVNARQSFDEINGVASEIAAMGGRSLAVLADVRDEDALRRMVAEPLERFGRLDILVNKAALRAVEALERIDGKRWREFTGVILDGAWLCARACLDNLKQSEAGAIVNIGGISAHTGAAGRSHIAAASAGTALHRSARRDD